MSTLKFNQWLNSDNSENYKCRAWVNFEGSGVVNIRASGNVTSITDVGVGQYNINFTTAMPAANYSTTVSHSSIVSGVSGSYVTGVFTTYVGIATVAGANVIDPSVVSVQVIR